MVRRCQETGVAGTRSKGGGGVEGLQAAGRVAGLKRLMERVWEAACCPEGDTEALKHRHDLEGSSWLGFLPWGG